MKNYYETLKIPKTAAAQDIKRAYFSLVKQFPPERFPDEFKNLREAYETLSNEQKRAEYDKVGGLPAEAAELLKKAEECQRIGRTGAATDILRSALKSYPEYPAVKAALARSLEREGKNGLAIKLWEELLAQCPDSAEYAHELAQSYSGRGWHKKAAVLYEKALEIDGGDADVWADYIDRQDEDEAKALCRRAITALRAKNRESVRIYAYCVYHLSESPDDAPAAEEYLRDMKRVMLSVPAEYAHEAAVDMALEGVMSSGNSKLVPLIREMAETLPHKSEGFTARLEKAGLVHKIKILTAEGFSDLLHDMFVTLVFELDSDDGKHDLMAMEYHILDDLPAYRPQLNRLKKEHPNLYSLNAAFFDEAIRTREPEKLMMKRAKNILKLGRAQQKNLEYDEDDDNPFPASQTVRRENPKTGRNEPCPCGSGKKYKRCCGAGQ